MLDSELIQNIGVEMCSFSDKILRKFLCKQTKKTSLKARKNKEVIPTV